MAQQITPQESAENNIAMADAVHDLGQSGRVDQEDLPYCQLALADMMFNTTTPSSKQGQQFTNDKGETVAFGAWKSSNEPDPANAREYMYHGLQKISGGRGPIFGDVQGEDVGGQVTSTSGRGTHSTYERYYSSIIYPEIERVSFQYILKSYHDWESAGKPTERPPGWVKYTGFRDRATMEKDKATAKQLLAANGIAMDDSEFFVGGERLITMKKYDKFGSLELFWQADDYSYQEYDMYNERNQRIMCDFIIKYLYPGRKTIEGKGVFVFDANAGSIKQLFNSLNQISSEINPMVLADSAGTCMHQLGEKGHGRNAFCFPFNTPSGQGEPEDRFITQANVHTGKSSAFGAAGTNFQFIRSTDQTSGQIINYGPTTYNIFTFQIFIGDFTPPNGEWTISFSKNGPSSGPSVPYLGSVIASIRKAYYNSNNPQRMIELFAQANPTPPLGSIMNITPQIISMMTYLFQKFTMTTSQVCLWVERLAMDIKKCGDWEQINSVAASMRTCPAVVGTAMLCTGDYLCSTKARLQGLNGCFHTEQGSGATGWKIELFRNPDISDPNQQQAINIVDKAKTVLPLLILATKNGVNNLRERIGDLRGITAQAVQTYKSLNDQILGLVQAAQQALKLAQDQGQGLQEAQAQFNQANTSAVSIFTSLFATVSLAQVCSRADSIFASMQPLQDLRLQEAATTAALNAALQAISEFQNYNAEKGGPGQNEGLVAYNQRFLPSISDWDQLINTFSGTESTIKHILIDLGLNEDFVNQLDTSLGADTDISQETVNSLIYAGATQGGVEIIVNNGEGVPTLNPAWTCGPAFQYDYTWITAVGLGQDTLLKQYLPKLDVELQKLTNFFLDSNKDTTRQLIEKQDVRGMRDLYRSFNAVITQLITANYIFDPKNTKKQKNVGDKTDKTKYLSYIKAAELSTNFYSADLSQLVKQAILVYDVKIPDSFNTWRDIPSNPDQVMEYYNGLKTVIEDFKLFASKAANDLLTTVLPPLYRSIGIASGGGNDVDKNQYGGLGGPSTRDNFDKRQDDALKKYFDTLLSTIIGYCRNSTYQITINDQANADTFVNALGASINTNACAFRLARAAFVKGCLLHPQNKMLVFGPQVSQDKLIAFLNEPIFGYLSKTFGIMQGNIPLYDVARLQISDGQKQIIYNTLLNNTIEELAQTDRLVDLIPMPEDNAVAILLIFMTAIGTVWSSSFSESVINAYDNLYVSNINPTLRKTEDVFANQEKREYEIVINQIPYVKRCVADQMLLLPQKRLSGDSIGYTISSSANFIRSPLRKLMFNNNSIARFASNGRFSPWTYTDSGDQDDIDIEAAGASMYPRMTSETQFKQDVLTSILEASQQLLRREDIDSARLCYGVANIPASYYKIANPDITQNILTQMQVNLERAIVQLTQQENEQERTLNMQRIIQENGQTVLALLTFLSQYQKYYKLSTIIQQNAGMLNQIYQSGQINTIPISIAPNVFSPSMASELQQKASAMSMGSMPAQQLMPGMVAGGKKMQRKKKKIDWYREKAKKIEVAKRQDKKNKTQKKTKEKSHTLKRGKNKRIKSRKQQIGCKGKRKTTRRRR